MSALTVFDQDRSQRPVRSLTLTHAVLYGLGVTMGAGIYVLVGVAAGRSGMHAGTFVCRLWVPVAGLVSSVAWLLLDQPLG